jgi:hypothetical protein
MPVVGPGTGTGKTHLATALGEDRGRAIDAFRGRVAGEG